MGETATEQSVYGVPVPTLRDPTPSPEDAAVTRRLQEAGELLGIELLDHIVLGDNRWVSLREKGLM